MLHAIPYAQAGAGKCEATAREATRSPRITMPWWRNTVCAPQALHSILATEIALTRLAKLGPVGKIAVQER